MAGCVGLWSDFGGRGKLKSLFEALESLLRDLRGPRRWWLSS